MQLSRRIWFIPVTAILAVTAWLIWPLYGFASQQFETARSPFGWIDLPETAPQHQNLADTAYTDAGAKALAALETRRKKINAASLSAAIVIDGKLIWSGASGWADVKAGKPATSKTVYRLGSTSKAMTATILARLVSEGTISLDTPISDYMADLPNGAWAKLTSRQLVSHTAGLPGYDENDDWIGFYQSLALRSRYDDPADSLSMFDTASLLYTPGEDYYYSSYDIILLSAIMQAAADMSYLDLLKEKVAEPASGVSLNADHNPPSIERATFYQRNNGQVKPWRDVDLSHKMAAGGLVGTPSDVALIGGKWLDDTYIPASIREEFFKPVRIVDGKINPEDYTLGFRRKSWDIPGVGAVEHLNHGGISKGSQFWLMIVPEHDLSLAIAMNGRTDSFFDFADVYVDLLAQFIPVKSQTAKNSKSASRF